MVSFIAIIGEPRQAETQRMHAFSQKTQYYLAVITRKAAKHVGLVRQFK